MWIRSLREIPGPRIRNHAEERQYGDVKVLYSTYHVMSLPEKSSSSHQVSPLMRMYLDSHKLSEPSYDGSNSDKENIWKSIAKMFIRPKTSIKGWAYDRALRLTKRQLSSCLEQGLCYAPEMVLTSVPALWWKYFGFKTKGEVLNCPLFWKVSHMCRKGLLPYPPYAIAGKRELLAWIELVQKKIRTFLMCSPELLVDEKYLYGEQDSHMKKFMPGFIRYGINFHNGGFHQMIVSSLRDFWEEGDISGWDRNLTILRDCQNLRGEGLKSALSPDTWEEIEGIHARVSEAMVNHSLLLPDGRVAQWDWSQFSGDGETTPNNCIAHNIITNYKLICAAPEATDDEILSDGSNVYGDDNLCSHTEQFSKLRKVEFVKSCYRDFGLTLKESAFKTQDSPIGMSFLGATCRAFEYGGKVYFIPSYKRDRIITGLQISLDPLTEDDEINKAFALLELGWYDCYEEIKEYIKFLFETCPDSPVKRSFLRKGIPSREDIQMSWAGLA